MKACRDCCHYSEPWGSACEHPELLRDDPINGKVCAWPQEERQPDGRCGPDAKLWTPIPPRFGFVRRLFGACR
jgi:hypothetical protein